VEYIPFEREAPERSFGKILEMISALSPKPLRGESTISEGEKSFPAKREQPDSPTESTWTRPKQDWQIEDYKRAIFHSIWTDDSDAADRIDGAYRETQDAADEQNRAAWESHVEFLRIFFGKGGDLDRLRELASRHPNNSRVLENLADALAEYDSKSAATAFVVAAEKAQKADEQQKLLGSAAVQYQRAELGDSSQEIVRRMKRDVRAGGGEELQLLRTLRELAEITTDRDVLLGILERIAHLAPDDIDVRFALAYQHSEAGNNDLALRHYLRIPYQSRNSTTWNNLGVCLSHFGLSTKAVDAYRKAEEMGETLAMSNIGFKFLAEGFIAEPKRNVTRQSVQRNIPGKLVASSRV
jgi:tetratricopeptide (TPR) repeat protein